MVVVLQDGSREVNVGRSEIWNAVYSTIVSCSGKNKEVISDAIDFFNNGKSLASNGLTIARQFNLIRDMLSQYAPEEAVFDLKDRSKKAPWEGNLSPVVTSCANLFTTADGKDLLYELVSIFTLSYYAEVPVCIK